MARLPRMTVPGAVHHVLQTAPAGVAVYRDETDARALVEALRHASRETRTAVHAYVLLPDRMHVLATPSSAEGIGRLMQRLGRRYVREFNLRHERQGALWEGRFRSSVIDAEAFLLASLRYIEELPVERGLVSIPQEHPWSSVHHHRGDRADAVIVEHPLYWQLGNTPFEREAAYRQLLQKGLAAAERQAIRETAEKGWPLGSAPFLDALARTIGRPAAPQRPGRRPKMARL